MGCCYSIFKKEDDPIVGERTGVVAHRIGTDDDEQGTTRSPLQGLVNLVMKKPAASSLPFPKDGIRLSSMKDFYAACGGKDKLLGLTTTDVNEKYQKPITAASQLSYCDYLKLQSSPSVGQAVVFISHGTNHTTTITTNTTTNTITNTTITTTISMEVHVLGCDRCS
jgi:hypothetical protein